VQAAAQALIDAGRLLAEWTKFVGEFSVRAMSLGFPPQSTMTFCKAPFDYLGDTLRGTKGIMMDMYRRPDKVLEAMDVVADMSIKTVIGTLNNTKGLTAVFPLHKGADGWMNEKQFDRFYWPSLKSVIDAFVDEGILVTLFAEGAFNTRLERVNEFPKGAVHWMFDRTDMALAKKILGDKCCISGNVPSSILVAGTPQEVKENCRKLIETCAPGGGYMLTSGTADLTEAKPENIRAMIDAAKEYGVYKK
jgi:uroporphyrinogen-III decarboxylase